MKKVEKIWKIEIGSYDCPDLVMDEGKVVCFNLNNESTHCKKETCPRITKKEDECSPRMTSNKKA